MKIKIEKQEIKKEESNLLTTSLFKTTFKDKHKKKFYKNLLQLLSSGVNLKKAIDILQEQSTNKSEKEVLVLLGESLTKGKTLESSMKQTDKFTPYEYYSIKLGEETSSLDKVLDQLYLFFERKEQMKKQITTVLTYPVFVLLITFGVLAFMMSSVVPMFADVYKQFGGDLPNLTKKIIYISENFRTYLFIFFGVILVISIIVAMYKNTTTYRKIVSGFVLKIPFFGTIVKTIFLTRFCQSMSLLLSAKTPLISALQMVEKMIRYYPIEITIKPICKEVIEGQSFGNTIEKYKVYDRSMVSIIKVAEEINELDTIFKQLSDQYADEVSHKTKIIGVVLEPLIITFIGLIVGVILIAMYMPMFNLSNIINNGM
ncbi:type II secretion system F family protein [Aureivirga marina]|uniref:type II secretion system F family protein n=1 Tax=Aureivirga marina TaxID=1182451 RepID=UPI0018CBE086|nr:type II secretion system F family protein [Aureivirga marina]